MINLKNTQIKNFFSHLDITEIESTLYTLLLKHGPQNISSLSKISSIPRTTVHENVEKLINKGIVVQSIDKASKTLVAERPEKLKLLLNEKKLKLNDMQKDLENIEGDLGEIIENMSNLYMKKSKEKLNVRFFKGKDQVRNVYNDVVNSNDVKAIVNVEKVLQVFPENKAKFSKAINSKKLKLWEIIEGDEKLQYVQTLNSDFYAYKIFPKGKSFFSMDIMLFNKRVLMIDFSKATISAVDIHNEVIFNGMNSIFHFLWEVL